MISPVSNPTLPATYYSRLGPIGDLVADPDVTEVMVMGTRDVYVEIQGQLHLTEVRFRDEDELLHLIRYIVESVGRRIDEQTPLCDARLKDGSRVHAAIRPVAVDGPMLTIRKFGRNPLQVADLVARGTCTDTGFAFLQACVAARANILVSGGTASGKTTLLNVLSGFIPSSERIVTIEDAAELQLRQRHVARLETRAAGLDGRGQITVRDLVISSLRMRPDRLVIGEVRGPEAIDMLQAMNTGHDGSMTTIHANRTRDALHRVETLVMMAGADLQPKSIRQQIAAAFHVLVHMEREIDGSRKIIGISEITGMEEDTITMQEIFRFARSGSTSDGRIHGTFEPSGLRPRILDRLSGMGLALPEQLSQLFPSYLGAGAK